MHSREKKSSSTHQNTSFLNQETLTATHTTLPTVRKLHNKENSTNCQNTERPPQNSNINKIKRQRNTHQVKEQDKCPPSQTKEEKIENLPDKEFRIMIVKMIQNTENKMESQINTLETRIEKMQERFNKDLEEIKKS